MTNTKDWIDGHSRLLRSLHWGDSDYKGHVFEAVSHILDKASENLRKLLEYPPIAEWLQQNNGGAYHELSAEAFGTEVPHVTPTNSTHSGFAALADAQTLLRTRGPGSAVDRIHTGVHGFLKSACDKASIAYPSEATANQLLKALIEHHPALQDLGPRSDDIRRMMKTTATIVDAMGTLRNKASLAHPNEELLGNDEALFVINLARSLLSFLDRKINPK